MKVEAAIGDVAHGKGVQQNQESHCDVLDRTEPGSVTVTLCLPAALPSPAINSGFARLHILSYGFLETHI